MDFRMASSPSAAAAAAAAAASHHHHHLFQQQQTHHQLLPPGVLPGIPPAPLFYYPGLPLAPKIPGPTLSSCPPASPGSKRPSNINNNNNNSSSSVTTVQPAAPPSSPHHHRAAPVGSHSSSSSASSSSSSSVVSPPSSGTAGRHHVHPSNGNSSSNNNSSTSSSSFAAALRHLAKQAGGPNDTEGESNMMRSPSRSNYSTQASTSGSNGVGSGGANGYAHNFTAERVKSPSPTASHRSSASSRKESPAAAAVRSTSASNSKNSRSSHHRDETSNITARSRSPPVVTIAPTLNSGLHFQDSRKAAYDRAMLCHTVPSSGSFGGGLSTGLSGAHPYSATPSLMATSSSSSSAPASSASDYRAQDLPSYMPPYSPYLPPRDDLFYGGLRTSMQQSAAVAAAAAAASTSSHYRPEENSLGMLPPRSSYHESLLNQLPASRPSSTLQEEYLLAARNSNFNPYALGSVPLEHSSLHPNLYPHPYGPYRSLEEQMYLERYGLLRPGASAAAAAAATIPSYPPLGFPSYLNFRYPSPVIHPNDLSLSMSSESALNRLKLEEEQRAKERIREEELAALASKPQEHAPHRPLATVTPQEQSSGQSQQERKERERHKEKRREREEANRKTTVQLPNESSSGRGVKVHTVSPLYASCPAETTPASVITISPTPSAEEIKRSGEEFSPEALGAMAVLKQQRSPTPARIQEEASVPLDLSEASTTHPPIEDKVKGEAEDPVKSLLDLRVERWKRKRSTSNGAEEGEEDDIDEEEPGPSEGLCEPNLLAVSVEQCLKSCPVPAGVSEEQHHFLHMFGLVTPKKRSDIELVKCIRRQNILREPTPPPVDAEEEDSATCLLKQRTRMAAALPPTVVRPDREEPDPELIQFATALKLNPTTPQDIESVEKSWNAVVADRMRRHFGQKQNLRKRVWNEAFRPLNFDQPNESNGPSLSGSTILKPVPQQPVRNGAVEGSTNGPSSTTEPSKLTSEVAFWLRHLKPTMARTLTASTTSATANSSSADSLTKSEELFPSDAVDSEVPTRWPGIDSVMVLYMAHQQELQLETKFLREHCERLHLQLAEGQATLSKLCLTLSSTVEMQRRCKDEDAQTLQSINDLQSTLKLLQSSSLR